MASAKKCDICGKFYEIPRCNDAIRIKVDAGYPRDWFLDLCDDCYDKLCNFVKPALSEDYPLKR